MIMALGLCFVGCDFNTGTNPITPSTPSTPTTPTTVTLDMIGISGSVKKEYCVYEELDLSGNN